LEPYELSRRVIALCQRGDVDLAVTALQKAPRNAQNIKVWNTIIQQCMEARKFNLAYSVFTDVRP
jgi:pentatricopeptide repeat protein